MLLEDKNHGQKFTEAFAHLDGNGRRRRIFGVRPGERHERHGCQLMERRDRGLRAAAIEPFANLIDASSIKEMVSVSLLFLRQS